MESVTFETCLTPNAVKARVFAADEHYAVALRDIRQCWPTNHGLLRLLWNTAALILRPDAIAGGQSIQVLPMLRDTGFVPVAAMPVRLSLAQTRELWRYQANVSTSARLRLLDLIMTSGKSLYILLHDLTARLSAPGTVHLNYLKGTAIVENRRHRHLRTLAGPRVTNILSYVHTSDDPADLLREIALLFPKRRWLELLREAEIAQDCTDRVRRLLGQLEAELPERLLAAAIPGESALPTIKPGLHWQKILNTEGLPLSGSELCSRWRYIVEASRNCAVFVTGNSYDGRKATVPDDKDSSLVLDGHLVFRDFGPR